MRGHYNEAELNNLIEQIEAGVPADELVREHSRPVQRMLQRAGLSRNSELTSEEVERAAETVGMFPDVHTPASKIRHYIMPSKSETDDA